MNSIEPIEKRNLGAKTRHRYIRVVMVTTKSSVRGRQILENQS